jgi:uncharacterized membrane protein YqjE
MDASTKQGSIVGAMSEIFSQVSDLVEKEIRLAKAEVTESITTKLVAGIWIGAGLLSAFLAMLLMLEGIAFILIRAGMAAHWACFLMALVIALLAAGFFVKGRASLAEPIAPRRAVRNVNRDIKTAKEQLT